jgi:hypothetical protein
VSGGCLGPSVTVDLPPQLRWLTRTLGFLAVRSCSTPDVAMGAAVSGPLAVETGHRHATALGLYGGIVPFFEREPGLSPDGGRLQRRGGP